MEDSVIVGMPCITHTFLPRLHSWRHQIFFLWLVFLAVQKWPGQLSKVETFFVRHKGGQATSLGEGRVGAPPLSAQLPWSSVQRKLERPLWAAKRHTGKPGEDLKRYVNWRRMNLGRGCISVFPPTILAMLLSLASLPFYSVHWLKFSFSITTARTAMFFLAFQPHQGFECHTQCSENIWPIARLCYQWEGSIFYVFSQNAKDATCHRCHFKPLINMLQSLRTKIWELCSPSLYFTSNLMKRSGGDTCWVTLLTPHSTVESFGISLVILLW